jgi:hypothetical protein
VIDRPNVRLGIIPWQAPAQVLPLHGFHLYDHRAVVVGTRSGTAIMGERDVPDYEELFSELERLAVFNGEARALLDRIADLCRVRHKSHYVECRIMPSAVVKVLVSGG